jgi:hypothetical protein
MKRHRHYEVGYGRPPVNTRFKPGQSGNPNGRPKGRKNMGDLLQEAFDKRIPIRQGETVRKVSTAEAIILAFVSKALKGDAKAFAKLFDLARLGGEFRQDPRPYGVIERVFVSSDGRKFNDARECFDAKNKKG